MIEEPKSSPEQQSDQNRHLDPLKFGEPVCRCESKVTYTNPSGQVFDITVTSPDQESLGIFLEDIRVRLEVLPGSEAPSFDKPDRWDEDPRRTEEDLLRAEPLITMRIDVVETKGIESPYTVDFHIDPIINAVNRIAPQAFYFPGRWIAANIHADSGNLSASLLGAVLPSRAFVAKTGPVNDDLGGSSPGNQPTTFTIKVIGNGQFDLTGQYGQ